MGGIIPFETLNKKGQRILLRSATIVDASAILQLSYDVIGEDETLVTTTEEFNVTLDQQKEFIHFYSSAPLNCIIVAEYNNDIIGMLTFQCETLKKFSHHGTIGMIVNKRWRGTGVGKTLLTTIIEWAHDQPFLEKLCLEVVASNKNAISLYKKLGFIEEGRQVQQVKNLKGEYDDMILMGKFLY